MLASTILDGVISTLDGIKGAVTGSGKLVADFAAVYRQLFDARAECLKLQGENATLKASVVELEQAVAREDAFDREKEKYELAEVGPRSFAYALKGGAGGEQPVHHLCVPCFQDRKVSLLQLAKRDFNVDTLACPRCSAQVQVPNDVRPGGVTVEPSPRRRLWDHY